MDAGKLSLGVTIRDGIVVSVEVSSTRPQASQVLRGKTPAQVMQIVPLLFSLCGRAQGAAAEAALQAAGCNGATAQRDHAIACEAIQEHLWRLMLDWPKLLGLPQQDKLFADWYAHLRKCGNGAADMGGFLREFELEMLGMPVVQWRTMPGDEVQDWWRKASNPLTRMLARLAESAPGGNEAVRLLPAWNAAQAQQECAGMWDVAFAARPHWQGEAAETGALCYYADVPQLHTVAQQYGWVLARVLARVFDVATLAEGSAAARLDSAKAGEQEGIAVARTARGLLMHHVKMAQGKVADYHIVAPTEWNFHPQGAFVQGLQGRPAADEAAARQAAGMQVLSLDPCVAYEIEVKHA